MTRPSRLLAVVTAAFLVAGAVRPADAYIKLGARISGGRNVSIRWESFPVRYFVTNRSVPGVSVSQFQETIATAFRTWESVESATLSSQFVSFTGANPFEDDGITVLGFLSRADLDRVLGATTFFIDNQTGAILEADIFFNSAFPWSVSSGGQPGRFDLESIAVHEIGHLFGLGHSAIGETELQASGRPQVIAAETVMFPIALAAGNIQDRTLKPDDIAGVSDLYPDSDFRSETGSISGKVTKDGHGVIGAHAIAFDPRTGKIVGGFTIADDGNFVIAGLAPGPHIVRVEPLDDGEVRQYFAESVAVDLDFRVLFFDRLVIVPRGGTSRQIELKVTRK